MKYYVKYVRKHIAPIEIIAIILEGYLDRK
jgi:hypothetical protein